MNVVVEVYIDIPVDDYPRWFNLTLILFPRLWNSSSPVWITYLQLGVGLEVDEQCG